MKGRKPASIVASDTLTSAPRAPAWLSPFAKAEWRRVVPDLVARRIISRADLGGLENYAVAMGRIREIEAEIQKADKIDPVLVRAADRAMQTARQFATEFGMTPVSRSRPTIRENASDDGADDLGLD